jgi:hypothetical protein
MDAALDRMVFTCGSILTRCGLSCTCGSARQLECVGVNTARQKGCMCSTPLGTQYMIGLNECGRQAVDVMSSLLWPC